MALQEVIDTIVPFTSPLADTRIEALFEHLVGKISGCIINYCVESQGRITLVDEDPLNENSPRRLERERYTSRITGTMSAIPRGVFQPLFISIPFECPRDPLKPDQKRVEEERFYGIKFLTPPGYKLTEINPVNLDFMETVRRHTEEFLG